VTKNLKWIIVAMAAAAFGGTACGSDGGGGGGGGNVCDESSSGFDENACEACLINLMACAWGGTCSDEVAAGRTCVNSNCVAEKDTVDQCEEAAYDPCAAAHPDDDDAFDACVEAACEGENAALDACGQSKCSAEQSEILACFERDCPEAAACLSYF